MNKVIHAIFGKKTSSSSKMRPAQTVYSMQCISNPDGGWEPVGFDENGHYVVLSRKTGRLVTLGPRSLNENTLRAVVGSKYCRDHYAEYDTKLEKEVFNPEILAEIIRNECDGLGRVDHSKIRSPGFYADAGKLLVHFGNEVYQSNGEPVDTTPGAAIYESGPGLGFSFDTPTATQEEVKLLEELIKGFNFQTSFGSVAVLGWFATAVFGAVVDNRPILAVTAESGSGKTTLIKLLNGMLGPQAFLRDGIPTTAQVLYELENRSAALLVDELEARDTPKQSLKDFLKLVRTSFTNSKDARFTRVCGGRMRSFNPPAGILVAGIALPVFDGPAESRTVKIQMQMPSEGGPRVSNPLFDQSDSEKIIELGARVRRLLMGRWDVLASTQKVVCGMLVGLGHEARAADLYSPLIAGYVALTSEELPSQEWLTAILEECQLTTVEVKNVQRDGDVCLSLLLNRRVDFYEEVGGKAVKSQRRIRDVIGRIMSSDLDDEMRRALIRQLEKFGLRPMWAKTTSKWKLVVATSDTNRGMGLLMQGTSWSSGGLKDVLLRLPGAIVGQQRVDGMSQKVVELCLTEDLVSPDSDGEYELPEAA